ncbi:hypothetical protein [Sulfitobacter donghicola]|uniref:Uncharacterized protein n=1 Tax=Sulfitobacter donghicola DSW-25 = KCTC 12864 = JCM 14565 TaxID=1300350 RepID=A0A073IFN8_9RHOB|nr:hypothetical protein [Sulfitobacter donghicola]KEJ88316.1 hypothetical protein DSW25_16705 [Sulfitobacter donghicola DSW-25 = KCTC 12864 = JCM 14565]KIN68912.1 hypothetical protein Z948_2644 [Sulfitobacter donghicola DSW-25 = KCTC 12864 = JCM 14565]
MSDKKPDQLDEKIDRFAEKHKLWLVIPLVIFGLMALKNPSVGIGLQLFFVWFFVWTIGKVLNAFSRLLPKSLTQYQQKAIDEAAGATLFFGGCAIIGIVLRNDNFVSDWLEEKMPGGMSLGFIDPVFASVVLLCIWVYTGYRVSR